MPDTTALGGTSTFVAVAAVEDVPPGWVLKIAIGQHELALANHEGAFYALDSDCSHAGGSLGDNKLKEGCLVECPWHNSLFDVRSGQPLGGPARKPQRTYSVKVEADTVYVSLR